MFRTLSRDICIEQMSFLLSLTADMRDWPPWTEENFLFDAPKKWELSFLSDAGVAIMSMPEPAHVHLHLLAVRPSSRGQGHGSRIMQEIKRRAGENRLTLKVPHDSAGAVSFYKRNGFEFDTRWWPMEFRRD